MTRLNESPLIDQGLYIDGAWCPAADGRLQVVRNPASGEIVGQVAMATAADVRRAIAAAEAALPAWRGLPARERAVVLRRWFDLIVADADDLARLVTFEQGKPLGEARGEVLRGAAYVEWFAEEAKRVYGDVVPSPQGDRRLLVVKQPVGVCAAITPWNFPSSMVTRKTAPALAAGCTVVLKPASRTPFSALALADLAGRAGIPPGVFNVVTGDAEAVAAEMTGHPAVRKLSFTGSTAVGRKLMARCAGQITKLALELGGNAPFIVFDDADVDAAIAGAVSSKFRNAGQTCVCADRFLVQAGIYEAFEAKFVAATAGLRVGSGLDPETDVGPLIDASAVVKAESLVADALSRGGRLLAGGRRHPLGGGFFEPTVIAGVTPEMRVFAEETFAPIAALTRFETEDEAIALANRTEYGLASYFFSRDVGRIFRCAEAIECGVVGVNTGTVSSEAAPFGGVKQSGIGREGSRYGIEDYLETKYLCVAGL